MKDRPASATGRQGERVALRFLESKGLLLLEQNYRRPFGEIDLVMRERDCLVFVEVRVRRRSAFGDGFSSITAAKRKKLWRAASAYLKSHPQLQKLDCRFDAISITKDEQGFHPVWIPGAFEHGE
ncbi:MAG: YraN family protein [Pseudomonadales bacterium]|nr:YraN family protein [Pseudomonadales bacterium]